MKALVLAGGIPQIGLIEELKSRGIDVIFADYYQHPPAEGHAPHFCISTLDVDAVRDLAKKECVDFIITICTDQALLTMATVSEELGLPCYLDSEAAMKLTNKALMKQLFCENDIPTAKFVSCADLDFAKIKGFDFPLVVKPVDCNSSKGVRRVESVEELKVAFADAKAASRTSLVIIEEYVHGYEISVDAIVRDGKIEILAVSALDKLPIKGKFIIFRAKFPARMSLVLQATIESVVQKIADAFNLVNSPLLIQLIVDGDCVKVVEFSARTGGGEKLQMLREYCGFDAARAVVDLTLNMRMDFKVERPRHRFYLTEFQYQDMNGAISSGSRTGSFTIWGDTAEELCAKYPGAGDIGFVSEHGVDGFISVGGC